MIIAIQLPIAFLSRLCGGEAVLAAASTVASFLSRLCGGEETWGRIKVLGLVSKPPMWR